MLSAQQLLEVCSQLLAVLDGLRRALTQLNQVIQRKESEPQQDTGQLLVGLS